MLKNSEPGAAAVRLATSFHLWRHVRMARTTKWKGWIKPDEVEPALLERIRAYNERYQYHVKKLGISDSFEAHNRARKDVPLTEAELDMKKRLLDK